MTNPYEPLFQPIQIGPVIAKNRFYQVPHCNGYGYRMPQSLAMMRGIKAEGGWGVVCTEEVEIHHSSDVSPYFEGRLWDEDDVPALALVAEAVHLHGALAGIELVHNGLNASNLTSRTPPIGPRSISVFGGSGYDPVQSRRMDREDFRNVRRWHRQAALRAKHAGFDIVYCYAAHGLSLVMQLILQRYNDRVDEYGGCLENRVRLLRELIEDTKEAVGDRCAVAVRFAVDELLGEEGIDYQGEGYEVVAMLAELPDLWDVNVGHWSHDSATSRFEKEGFQEKYTAFVKKLTSKPVVGVGRYTSPNSMLSALRRGVLDLIGAARPSIADPFLPNKIKEARHEDIRECIGCNICVTGDTRFIPIRCTQNPTMGEEWRRGWHPEYIPMKKSNKDVMVIGAGPAGSEVARGLGQRGYRVVLLEADRELGGRVLRESALPGLNEWRRVADWRLGQIKKLPKVTFYPGSHMNPQDILDSGAENIIIATGANWKRDGTGRTLWKAIPGYNQSGVFCPDDLMDGKFPSGRVIIFDDDNYYMGGVLAELCMTRGCCVTFVTTAEMVSPWTQYTLEQERIQYRLMQMGVEIITRHFLSEIQPESVYLTCSYTGKITELPSDSVVLVTDRLPKDDLYQALKPFFDDGKLQSLRLIGDAEAPSTIAQAVFAGHLAAREFDEAPIFGTPFKIERIKID